jgi:quercetin dioxygenase-like cupin family protein/predicted ester cyclase
MNKTLATLALTLMLLTGIVLGQLRILGSTWHPPLQASDRFALNTAARFHDAINAMLESGDPSKLRAVLHSDFIDHAQFQQDPGTVGDLEDYLTALHQFFPDLRFFTANTVVNNDLVASNLSVTGNLNGVINGIQIEIGAPLTGFELVRVDNDQVIEHWASPTLPVLPQIESFTAIDEIAPRRSTRTLRFERLSFDPLAQHEIARHEGSILVVKNGTVHVQWSSSASASIQAISGSLRVPVSGAELQIGKPAWIPAGTSYRLTNVEAHRASVLLLTISEATEADQAGDARKYNELSPGVSRDLLVGGASLRPDHGPWQLTIHQVLIGAATAFSNHNIKESEFMLVLEGNIEVSVRVGEVGLLSEQDTVARRTGKLDLSPGQGIFTYPGAEVSYRASAQSPATFWLVTLTQVD